LRYIVETKGREDLDDPLKIARLKQWCEDVNAAQDVWVYRMLYIKQEEWEKYEQKLHAFTDLIRAWSS
jgi:type III restriction enzyme